MDHIQQELDQFKHGWNNHKMRTCHNRSPMQQCIFGLRCRSESFPNDPAVTGLHLSDYGIDWSGPVSTDGNKMITVPEFPIDLQNSFLTETLDQQLQNLSSDKIICYIVAKQIINFVFVP